MKHVAFLLSGAFLLASVGCSTVENTTVASGTNSGSASARNSASESGSSFKATAEADRASREGSSNITPYPFTTCAVQWHKPFKDGKAKHRRVYKGQEVLFCCTPCVKAFDMNPDPYMPRILAAAN